MDLSERTDLPYRFFKLENSNRWNIRFSIKGFSQIEYALGTADDEEACDATLKRENVTLRGVFNHAVNKGYLKHGDVPKQERPRVKQNKLSTSEQKQATLAAPLSLRPQRAGRREGALALKPQQALPVPGFHQFHAQARLRAISDR